MVATDKTLINQKRIENAEVQGRFWRNGIRTVYVLLGEIDIE